MAENTVQQTNEVVVDKGKSSWSDLWKLEDYWAIWLGFVILVIGALIFFNNKPAGMDETFTKANAVMAAEANRAPFKTVAWYEAQTAKEKVKAKDQSIGKTIAGLMAHPKSWTANPLNAFIQTKAQADAKNAKAMPAYEAAKAAAAQAKTDALAAQAVAEQAGFLDAKLNADASSAIESWLKLRSKESSVKKKVHHKPYNLFPGLALLLVGFGAIFAFGMHFIDGSSKKFIKGFGLVFAVAVLAYLMASQATMKKYGVGDAAWAIAIGLLISNTIGTPNWAKKALQVEFFIKTGLVLLGAEVLFNKIVAIGIPGIFVAWVVTPVVLITTFIFGQKVIKMPSKTLNMVISADMSVCGTSAAIATAAACKAKKEELTLSIGLSLVFTSIMMVLMPAVIKATGMPYILGGAWMGGTIDATGAVAAAGAFLSEKALYVAATIKMIQNVMIGVTAFGVAIYWCTKVECVEGQSVSAMEIWYRFPKFVLGFLTASVIFSVAYSMLGSDAGFTMIDQGVLRGFSRLFRGWFFCLSFAAIGLATNFRELKHYFKGGKPLILYVCGQSFNLALTLLMAYLMFYVVFPDITAKI
ncbi:putative sulfate exporter family transporter [Pseudodesulfovibrio sp.]|uniref:YeiH family protein n=1 Tax=Pseudodesulfovibrio sp. TaxID=2035812 RepID=UPI0026214692|nr:putative sulfate exporter family transporter [Pseudodesulfovibrio sp.]MDD3312528.1 putative sulfate exporter family transporter [Pseudodesulfovibrio sp.]